LKRIVQPAMWITALLVSLALITPAAAQDQSRALRVAGAGMSADQVDAWAKLFTQANPAIKVVVSGSSAGAGFRALMDGQADIALLSRPLLPEEEKAAKDKGLKLEGKEIGRSGLSIITGPANPVSELTIAQLRKIFAGELANWNEVGGPAAAIKVVSRRAPESGGAVFFKSACLNPRTLGRTPFL
jgi:phosphate transport system substrate-binding protein